jgi:electron transfer flavoprotein beta subunit
LKIVVLIKNVLDTKILLECDEDTHRLKEDWNVPILNPDDAAAVAAALKIKQTIPETHVTLVHLGPPREDRFIKEAVALGCDDGLRIWDEDLEEIRVAGKAIIFSRTARVLGFDLILAGTSSLDTGSGQLAILLASDLQLPCITRVISIDAIRADTITVTRIIDRGYQKRIESAKPLVIAMVADSETAIYASFPAVVEASQTHIPCLDLSQIGIARDALQQADSRLKFGPLQFPVPKLQFLQPPDSSLPAFERRCQLGEFSLAKREKKIVKGEEDMVAEEIFRTLLRQGWLDHLRKNGSKA